MSGNPSIVYVLDDDEIVLWLYRELLQHHGVVLRPFTSPRAFLDSYAPSPCECLVCDLRMPELCGLGVQNELLSTGDCLPIIFVSGHAEVSSVVEAMRVGAFDFLEKPVDGERLVRTVHAALEHSRGLHARRLAMAERRKRLATLTPKEREIAEHVASGKSSRQISEALNISVRTVENHRARVTEKLCITSVAELVRLLYDLPDPGA